MKKIKWLRWDGSYDLNGLCNHRLTPLNDLANQRKAIKERLYLLGFDCGQMDNAMNPKTKQALITFNGYCNHPTIHRRPTMPNIGTIAPRGNLMPDFQLADFPSVVEMTQPKADGTLLDFAVEVGAQPWVDPEWDNDFPVYDNSTIDCLNQLFPEIQAEEPPPVAPGKLQVFINRFARERHGNTATLNAVSGLAVKIISTPESISPFLEYGGIKIEINGYEKVKSLMVRIYRSFEAVTDETAIPGEKIVYQEILNEAEIKALSVVDLNENKGKLHEARAHILKQNVGGGLDGSFGVFYGLFYERIDAPYKVRVWVSETADFFNAYKPAANTDSRKFVAKTNTVVGYLDLDAQLNVRRLRADALDDENPPPNLTEPNIDHIKTVHDKSHIFSQDLSEPSILENWQTIVKDNTAIYQPALWTEKDENKTNIIETKCPNHDKTFLRDNQLVREAFSDEFKNDPLATYWDARERLDQEGENFKFAKLKDVCDNARRHINLIKRRVCCGQWSHIAAQIKTDINQTFDNVVLPELTQLEINGYPYKDTLFFLNKFISFFSYIAYKGVDEIEYNFYQTWGITRDAAGASVVRDRRAKIRGGHMIATELNRYFNDPLYANIQPAQTFHIHPKTTGNSVKLMTEKVGEIMGETGKSIGKPILVPSYNPLNVHFFNRIRAVPMFLQGMLDMQYLIADEIPQTPIGFMDHDAFHVAGKQVGGGAVQQWETLYNRLCELTDIPYNLTEKQVYKRWQKNIDNFKAKVEAVGNEVEEAVDENDKKRFCLEFLMFFILHEPAIFNAPGLDNFVGKFGINAPVIRTQINEIDKTVTIIESTQIRNRIRMGALCLTIMKRLNYDFFGQYANDAVPYLRWGFKYLHRLSMYMSDLPAVAETPVAVVNPVAVNNPVIAQINNPPNDELTDL